MHEGLVLPEFVCPAEASSGASDLGPQSRLPASRMWVAARSSLFGPLGQMVPESL